MFKSAQDPIGIEEACPTKLLDRVYNQVVVHCLFVWFAKLVLTASSNSKCCPADQTRPDQMIKMIKMIKVIKIIKMVN